MHLLFYIGDDLSKFEIISFVLGGIALFLFGIHIMGESLKNLAGNKLKIIIEKTTNTTVKGILTGAAITVLIQSSSGTTAIVVALISAGLMTLPQAVAVIMGANIGTTITAIIIGLNISDYSLIIVGAGALLCFFAKKQKFVETGNAILGFGLLFFGLDMMGTTLKQFAENPRIIETFQTLSKNPLLGVGVGTVTAAIIQSSSATIGIVQKLYAETGGSLLLHAAIPLLLGSNIGTTITAVISSLNSSRNAKRAALAHVLFNVVGVTIFMIFLNPYTSFVGWVEKKFLSPFSAGTIAVAHVLFNVTTTIFLAFFVKQIVWIVQKILKPTKEEEMISAIDKLNHKLLNQAPVLALENVHFIIVDMSKIVDKMFELFLSYFQEPNSKIPEEVFNLEDVVDSYDSKLHDFVAELSSKELSERDSKVQAIAFDTIRDLERIADHLVNLTEFLQTRYNSNIQFHPVAYENINHMLILIKSMIDDSFASYEKTDKAAARRVTAIEPQIDELEKLYRKQQIAMLGDGTLTNSDLHYVDILSNLERIGDHTNNIAENIITNSVHIGLKS